MSVSSPVVDTWDGVNRRIFLKQGITTFHWLDDIYTEYRNERRLNEDFRKWEPFMVASGNVPKGGGKATPRLLTLLLGVKVVPFNENITIDIFGEAITDNADVDPTLFDTSTRTEPVVLNYQPPSAEVIVVDEISKALDYRGVVNYDENSSYSGTEHPVGTLTQPVNNISDALGIMANYNLQTLKIQSDLNLDQNVSNIEVIGALYDHTIFPNGFMMDKCRFENLCLDGDFMASDIYAFMCCIDKAFNISGELRRCTVKGIIRCQANETLTLSYCESGLPGQQAFTLDMNPGQDVSINVRNFSGGILVQNCDTAACVATIEYATGRAILDSTNTDGYLSVRGIASIDDQSLGTTVDTSVLIQPVDITQIKDILEGDMVPTANEWQILHKLTKAVLVRKDAVQGTGPDDGLTQLIEP